MWNDIEATQDLLNFKVMADTAAQIIIDANGQPISIGVSGSWGVGKSSLVKMIGESIKSLDDKKQYIFIDFNAWLYQGYDDARIALLQKVADKILEESELQKNYIDKAKQFIKRINWLRTAKLAVPVATGLITGSVIAGPLGGFLGAVGGLFSQGKIPNSQEVSALQESYNKIAPELHALLNDKKEVSIPKEIDDLRTLFQDLLIQLKLTLVVLVDDLDRCLPDTAISTLEAMRLLLFLPQTAFIIAADEQMIRNAVKSHFGNIDLSDELVTSYFDKLIQIPLRVPRLGTNEVKGYLMLLLADLAQRNNKISESEKDNGHITITAHLKKSWAGGLTKKMIEEAYGQAASKLSLEIDMADQLANIMATSNYIAGNPRLIKRFLNNLMIRKSVAKAQGMSVPFDALVKLQLLERCAPAAAFEYLAKEIGNSENGKSTFLRNIEDKVSKAEELNITVESWKNSFIAEWIKLSPRLSDIDLRPLLYLSRDKMISFANFDELSPEGKEILSAICEATGFMQALIQKIQKIGLIESEKIFTRMRRKARDQQWEFIAITQALHLPKSFPELENSFITMLDEIPAKTRPTALIPLLRNELWAKELLERWEQDDNSPQSLKNAINNKKGK